MIKELEMQEELNTMGGGGIDMFQTPNCDWAVITFTGDSSTYDYDDSGNITGANYGGTETTNYPVSQANVNDILGFLAWGTEQNNGSFPPDPVSGFMQVAYVPSSGC